MKFVLLINLRLLTISNSFLLNIVEHEISFITSGPRFLGVFCDCDSSWAQSINIFSSGTKYFCKYELSRIKKSLGNDMHLKIKSDPFYRRG